MSEDNTERRRERTADETALGRAANRPGVRAQAGTDWETVPADPDFAADFGYMAVAWERVESLDDTDQVVYLPDDEEQMNDDAFVVVERSVVVDLEDNC